MAIPLCGKRRSLGAVDTELKTAKPEKRVKEHPNEPLTVSNGKHFAVAYGHNGHFFSIIGTFLENCLKA